MFLWRSLKPAHMVAAAGSMKSRPAGQAAERTADAKKDGEAAKPPPAEVAALARP